jgi:hypothetical protein
MFVNVLGQHVQSLKRTAHRCFLPPFGSFDRTVSEENNLKNQPIRNKSRLWQSCLLMDRDEMSNLYREPSIDASYKVSGSFGQAVSGEKIFKNRPIRNKNCLWRPCLLMDRDEMSNIYRGPSIDASVQLAEGFQRRRLKCEKLTDDGRQVMAKAHIAR